MLGIEIPLIQAAIWPATSPELVAAVGEAGAIGSLGAVFGSAERVTEEIERVRELTEAPFIVNHVVPQLDEGAFEATLAARPKAVSFALGLPEGLVERVHAAGAKAIHQVHTVAQAREAAALGVDAIIAQGSEAGGQGMLDGVSTLALVPQVVDAVAPIPTLAAGGIADGRGFAAALAAGAEGVNVGTVFLASEEAAADEAWKQGILASESEEVIRFAAWAGAFPPDAPGAYPVVPRLLRTEFVERWNADPEGAVERSEQLRAEVGEAIQRRTPHELVPFTGQTAGLVTEVLPAGEIVGRMASDAAAAGAQLSERFASA